ncbi:SpoIIIAH-like family protein [Paenibacillus sp. KN14-4R]|uniref:SpoIIIAH-like family protein n=1 Tax=Paenibacillus sp. KN14-4R TaxID=3445773 RepID=UPI003F9F1064
MNSKRQTIWLVSMLSLLVVLSAYYLISEDTSKLDTLAGTDKPAASEIKIDMSQDPAPVDGKTVGPKTSTPKPSEQKPNEINKGGTNNGGTNNGGTNNGGTNNGGMNNGGTNNGGMNNGGTNNGGMNNGGTNNGGMNNGGTNNGGTTPSDPKTTPKTPDAKQTTAQTGTLSDKEILQKMQTQAQSGADYFQKKLIDREVTRGKETEKWLAISVDKAQTPEAVGQAQNELRKIQETNAKVENIEDMLSNEYSSHVIVEQEQVSGKWKVTVQAAKLDKTQAVSILDMVMKELNVGPEKISGVQYFQ